MAPPLSKSHVVVMVSNTTRIPYAKIQAESIWHEYTLVITLISTVARTRIRIIPRELHKGICTCGVCDGETHTGNAGPDIHKGHESIVVLYHGFLIW